MQTNDNWNGDRANFFNPCRGIHQGDPISPYLFVICIYKLSHMIMEAVEKGSWKAPIAGRTGPHISHLMFADDLLLFGQATEDQMREVMSILNSFCQLSGQEVSQTKTNIFFFRNVKQEVRNVLVGLSGFSETVNLGKYLGVLLGGGLRASMIIYILSSKLSLSSLRGRPITSLLPGELLSLNQLFKLFPFTL